MKAKQVEETSQKNCGTCRSSRSCGRDYDHCWWEGYPRCCPRIGAGGCEYRERNGFHSFDEREGNEFPSGKFFRDWYGARSRVCWL